MKGTLLAICLHLVLAGIVYAATATEPTKPLPPEDTLIAKADYPNQNCQIQIWQTRADLLLNGKPYTLTGTATRDEHGAVELLESPTGNTVSIFPDGSADVLLAGVRYQFDFEF